MDTAQLVAAMISKARHAGRADATIGNMTFVVMADGVRFKYYAGAAVSLETMTSRIRSRIQTHPARALAVYKELQQ